MPDNLEQIRIDYWTSLGWLISQSLGLWNAEKSFAGFEDKFAIEGVETFEELDKLINVAELENAKTTDDEQGLAVIKPLESLSVYTGDETVNLDGETPIESVEFEDEEDSENIIDAETEEPDGTSKQQPPRVFETLKVILTKEEKEKKTSELLQVMNTRDESESRFESVKNHIKPRSKT